MTAPFRPGQRLTEERLNTGQLIGRLVFQIHRSVVQATSSDTSPVYPDNAIEWDTLDLDVLGGWSSGTNPTRYTPTVAGWYELNGAIGFASTSAGSRRGAAWFINGTGIDSGRTAFMTNATTASGSAAVPARTLCWAFNGSTDYVELVAIQTSGGSLNTNTGTLRPHMTVTYAGPLD